MAFRDLFLTRPFGIAYFATLAIFFVVTAFLIDSRQETWIVGSEVIGFPFAYYYSGCWTEYYLWGGLFANAATGASTAFVGGTISILIAGKLASPEFAEKREEFRVWWAAIRVKWYL